MFDTLILFLKELFVKVNFEKKSTDNSEKKEPRGQLEKGGGGAI